MRNEAKTQNGRPYKVWVMIRDANDGEMRVVPRALVKEYTRNFGYAGSWSITMRGALDDLRVMGRVAYPHEWLDMDGHYRYTDAPREQSEQWS